MSKLYFIPGSQDLYGEECLKQVAADCRDMVGFLNEKLGDVVDIELLPTVETAKICVEDIRVAENDGRHGYYGRRHERRTVIVRIQLLFAEYDDVD